MANISITIINNIKNNNQGNNHTLILNIDRTIFKIYNIIKPYMNENYVYISDNSARIKRIGNDDEPINLDDEYEIKNGDISIIINRDVMKLILTEMNDYFSNINN
jgi:hypothetical protein